MKNLTNVHLQDLDSTIIDIRHKISEDPDPFLVDVLKKLIIIRNQNQNNLENNAKRSEVCDGFKGIGVS